MLLMVKKLRLNNEKAYLNKRQVYIHTNSLEEAEELDVQLWTFRDISFVPHLIHNTNPDVPVPVLIGYGDAPENLQDILVNLALEVPHFHTQFQHIIEVVPNDEAQKKASRAKYKYYKKQDYQIETHEI